MEMDDFHDEKEFNEKELERLKKEILKLKRFIVLIEKQKYFRKSNECESSFKHSW